ncbi:hypothetical protein BRADI_4g21811v3, partial [Brachypodium distachyon]
RRGAGGDGGGVSGGAGVTGRRGDGAARHGELGDAVGAGSGGAGRRLGRDERAVRSAEGGAGTGAAARGCSGDVGATVKARGGAARHGGDGARSGTVGDGAEDEDGRRRGRLRRGIGAARQRDRMRKQGGKREEVAGVIKECSGMKMEGRRSGLRRRARGDGGRNLRA